MKNQDFRFKTPSGISYRHSILSPSETAYSFYHAESHRAVELLLLLQGTVFYSIDGAHYTVNAGDLIIINAGEFHSSRPDHTTLCERINLHFPTTLIPTLSKLDCLTAFSNASLYQHIIPKKIIEKTKTLTLFRKIATIYKNKDKYQELKIVSAIQLLLAELNQAVDKLMNEQHYVTTPTIKNELFQTAIDYINANLKQALSPTSVAEYLGISESYLHRLFKINLGISIHNYIKNQKMQLAFSLLQKGYAANTVSEILGYEYYTTFFNAFKSVFSKSPTQLLLQNNENL